MCEMFDRQLNFLQKNTIPTSNCRMYAANFPYRARARTATGGSNWGSVEVIDLEFFILVGLRGWG